MVESREDGSCFCTSTTYSSRSASMPSNPPNTSIYVKNLNFKIKKTELRTQLFNLFSTYGKVIDVVATRANGMRGQAFIVFKDLQSSTAALRALDGFQFYEKPMSIDYAKSKSKATLVQEHGPSALYNPSLFSSTANAGATSQMNGRVTISSAQAEARGREKKRAREEAGGQEDEDEEEGERGSKVQKTAGNDDDDDGEMAMEEDSDNEDEVGPQPPNPNEANLDSSANLGPPKPQVGEVANQILFCSDLPTEITDDMLGVLFQQYPGFKSVQLFPARASRSPPEAHAFIEFDSSDQASVAKEALNEFKLSPEKSLLVHWAKRGD